MKNTLKEVKAKLIKHNVDSYPYIGVKEDIPLGTEYTVYPETVCKKSWGDRWHPGMRVEVETVFVYRERQYGWLPLELLKLEDS